MFCERRGWYTSIQNWSSGSIRGELEHTKGSSCRQFTGNYISCQWATLKWPISNNLSYDLADWFIKYYMFDGNLPYDYNRCRRECFVPIFGSRDRYDGSTHHYSLILIISFTTADAKLDEIHRNLSSMNMYDEGQPHFRFSFMESRSRSQFPKRLTLLIPIHG